MHTDTIRKQSSQTRTFAIISQQQSRFKSQLKCDLLSKISFILQQKSTEYLSSISTLSNTLYGNICLNCHVPYSALVRHIVFDKHCCRLCKSDYVRCNIAPPSTKTRFVPESNGIVLLYSTADQFWQTNVCSPETLKQHYSIQYLYKNTRSTYRAGH